MSAKPRTLEELWGLVRGTGKSLKKFDPRAYAKALNDAHTREALERLFPQAAKYVPTVAKVRQPVDHRPRSDLPGASNVGADALTGATRWSVSRNWCGAVLGAHGGRRFDIVSATWTLPTDLRVPPGAASGQDDYRVSIWVGLDGHRVASPSMPQIGTTLVLRKGEATPKAYGWMQWWVRGKGGKDGYTEVEIEDFPLVPGETVTCGLFMSDQDDVHFSIRRHSDNELTGKSWVSHRLLSEDVEKPRKGEAVAGSGACFVVERPMKHGTTEMFPLPDFGEVTFRECWARTQPLAGSALSARRVRDIRAARRIRMVDVLGGPGRMATLASPARRNGSGSPDSFTIHYGRTRP